MTSSRKPTVNKTKEIISDSIKISYFIVSFAVLLLLISIFILPHNLLLNMSPVCEWKLKYGTECFFCGMTRAFILLSEFNFPEAYRLNALSIPLFGFFLINGIFAALSSKGVINNIRNNYRNNNADN
jgi:hypothetical protein